MYARWLKFSNRVVNPAHITYFKIEPERITVYINAPSHHGSMLFGSGFLYTDECCIYCDKKETPKGYKYLMEWIDKIPG